MPSIAVVCLLVATAQAPSPADSLERDRVAGALGTKLDAHLTRLAEYGFSGTVRMARAGQIVLLKGYGLVDIERGIPNSAATRFEMNSLTKMFTGASVLALAAAGRLGVTDPLERHLGAFPPGKLGATVEHLASHTSGLVVAGTDLAGDSREAFVRDVKRTPREAPPGTQYRYTNAGFSLLAALIEVVTGRPYEEYVRQNLFAPAGMRTAIFRDQVPLDDTRFARG